MTPFYQGKVAKLTFSSKDHLASYWQVVDVLDIDTNCDENMHINFSHNTLARAIFIPGDNIHSFDSTATKKVKRIFNQATGLEYWEAVE